MLRNQQGYPYQETVLGVLRNADLVLDGYHDGLLGENLTIITWNHYGMAKRVSDKCEAAGGAHIAMENGYFLRSKGFYVMARDGFNGRESRRPDDTSTKRWESLDIELKPWKKNGSHVLVCGQRGGNYSDMSMPVEWPERVMCRLREFTDRPIFYRPHPHRERLPNTWVENSYLVQNDVPLQTHLANAHAVVTWTSNAATDALIDGVPVFYSGPTIAAAEVAKCGIEGIEDPLYAEREPVFHRMANNQWHLSELNDGTAWRRQSAS